MSLTLKVVGGLLEAKDGDKIFITKTISGVPYQITESIYDLSGILVAYKGSVILTDASQDVTCTWDRLGNIFNPGKEANVLYNLVIVE